MGSGERFAIDARLYGGDDDARTIRRIAEQWTHESGGAKRRGHMHDDESAGPIGEVVETNGGAVVLIGWDKFGRVNGVVPFDSLDEVGSLVRVVWDE